MCKQVLDRHRLLLLIALAFLTACAPAPEETLTQDSPPSLETKRLVAIAARGTLIAGVRETQRPFGFRNEAGELVGFEVDLVAAVARELGVGLELKVVQFKEAIPFVKDGTVDLAAAVITHKLSREADIDFSITYFMDKEALMVRKGSGISSIDDIIRLGGKIGFVKGVSVEASLTAIVPEANLARFDESLEYCSALENGLIMAIATDATLLLGNRTRFFKRPELYEIIDVPLDESPIAMLLPEDESDFRDAVNAAIVGMVKSGEYRRIFEKWFGPGTGFDLSGFEWTPEIWP
jgi:polar amino acid transport system substrate-binding protein